MKNKQTINSFLMIITLLLCFGGCKQEELSDNLEVISKEYVKLGLAIGQYDPYFVDAYYGPDSLRPSSIPKTLIPKDSLLMVIDSMKAILGKIILNPKTNDTIKIRAKWITNQLTAFNMRIRLFTGENFDFDEESLQLFSIKAPTFNEQYFQSLVAKLDSALPGKGSIQERYQKLSNRFIIPKEKVATVIETAIAEARRRTKEYLKLPEGESIKIEYMTGKSWSAYNWYKGNYTSLIQVNTDLPLNICDALDLVVCHEGYPGHHVYNMMLEKKLLNDRGWLEVSIYPLFSPQSFISEGAADYGVRMVFPGQEYNRYIKNVLIPIANIDTTGIDTFFKVQSFYSKFDYAFNEVARGIINGKFDDEEILKWQKNYMFMTKLSNQTLPFIREYGSYVICYNYGEDLVTSFIEAHGKPEDDKSRWQAYGWLLCNLVTPSELSE
jgi:hypothetical protein